MRVGSKLPSSSLPSLKEALLALDDEAFAIVEATELKNPTTAFFLAFFAGGFGADHFYLGNNIRGLLKLLTCGGGGIWSIINLITVTKRTRKRNLKMIKKQIKNL